MRHGVSEEVASLMTRAKATGWVALIAMFKPGGNHLFRLPSENSDEVRHLDDIGYGEEWRTCVQFGCKHRQSVAQIIDAFIDLVRPDFDHDDLMLRNSFDAMGYDGSPVDLNVGVLNSLDRYDVLTTR